MDSLTVAVCEFKTFAHFLFEFQISIGQGCGPTEARQHGGCPVNVKAAAERLDEAMEYAGERRMESFPGEEPNEHVSSAECSALGLIVGEPVDPPEVLVVRECFRAQLQSNEDEEERSTASEDGRDSPPAEPAWRKWIRQSRPRRSGR